MSDTHLSNDDGVKSRFDSSSFELGVRIPVRGAGVCGAELCPWFNSDSSRAIGKTGLVTGTGLGLGLCGATNSAGETIEDIELLEADLNQAALPFNPLTLLMM